MATTTRTSRRSNVEGTVYIGRFARPIGNPNVRGGTATFYVGWTEGSLVGPRERPGREDHRLRRLAGDRDRVARRRAGRDARA
jgi:hypothetical protein